MRSPEELKEIKSIPGSRGSYGELQVCYSAAGFYIGRMFHDDETGYDYPGSRESGYYRMSTEAQKALDENTFFRDCQENEYMYRAITP